MTDPGVLVEVMFAHQMGKPVLGYRTEARSPYGNLGDFTNGMHFFKFFPLDAYLQLPTTPIATTEALRTYCTDVAKRIEEMIAKAETNYKEKFPEPQIT